MSTALTADDVNTARRTEQELALDAFFEGFYRRRPVTATFTGIHEHDHVLPDFSPELMQSARDEMCQLRRRLAEAGLGVLHSEELRSRDWPAIDGALADSVLEVKLAEDESLHFVRGNPSLAIGEALFSIIALARDDDAPVEPRVEAAVSRLRAVPAFLHGARRTLGEGEMPAAWRDRAIRECEGGLLLLSDLPGWPVAGGAPVALCRDLQEAAAHASAAVEWFRSYLAARQPAPASRYAAGHGLLSLLIRRGHWCDVPIERLQHEARAALERETFHLRDALQGEEWPAVATRMAAWVPDTGDVLDAAKVLWQECRDLAGGEVTWPDAPLPYRFMPAWAMRAAPFLYYLPYRSPAPMSASLGHYDVPRPSPTDSTAMDTFVRMWNRSTIKLNHVAHHGGFGHHVQNWHASRSPSRIGRVAAVDTACRIAMFCGGTMAEGWACYATEVMESLGFLSSDERVAEHHTRVRLMTRAVVDLELHTGRMSFDEAVRFHVSSAQLTPAAAHAEVTKCSMFPGTAMMYWLGLRDLWRLRTAEEASRGAAFSSRGFHDELLSFGSMPVPLVARLMAAARPQASGHGPKGRE
ncbi:MAG TPA: DUF885 family protein [Gemmatimonadaceae bacterium]|nr:DUF885 family protein [Gemmatimonadaceae bacterium]